MASAVCGTTVRPHDSSMSDLRLVPGSRIRSGIQAVPQPLFGGIGFNPEPASTGLILPTSPVLDDIGTLWDPAKFAVARAPVVVGAVDPGTLWHDPWLLFGLPIKFPGSSYRVPIELEWLHEFLQLCINAEQLINADLDNYYAYLDVECSFVPPHHFQRLPGPHSDAIQGRRIQPKQPVEHFYATVSYDPTRFFVQPFDLADCNLETHYVNPVFAQQAHLKNVITHKAGEITLFDAYTIHEAIQSLRGGERTFVRLGFSTRQYDRLGNAHNPLFDYAWEMVPRPLPDLIGIPE